MLIDTFKRTGLVLAVAGVIGLTGCANLPGSESAAAAPVAGVPRLVTTTITLNATSR